MNNTVLKVIAGLLLVGSLIVAYIGIRLSRQPLPPSAVAPAASAPTIPTEMVVVASRPIKAGHRVELTDLGTKNLPQPPANTYRQPDELVGKVALRDIPTGAPLAVQHFAIDSMASLLRDGERAVAVNVDEVIGVGGYAQPGDRVDVLLFLAGDRSANNQDMAQIVIQNARLLTLGDANQMDKYREQLDQPEQGQAKTGDDIAQPARRQRQNLRSAVLAIATKDVTRLMLASARGQLRLALRPAQVANPANADPLGIQQSSTSAVDHQVVRLSDLGQQRATAPGSATGRVIIIQEGSQERPLTQGSPAPSRQEVGL